MSELIRLSGGDHNSVVGDVVFVHGLAGDARHSWGFDQRSGWHIWLSEDCPETILWTLSYNASLTTRHGEPCLWKIVVLIFSLFSK